MKATRRESLRLLATAATFSSVSSPLLFADTSKNHPLIATNTYPWLTFARRNKEPFEKHTDPLLASIAETGITGYEPIIDKPTELEGLGDRLKKHGLKMRSLYVNSVLHDESKAEESMANVLSISEAAKKLGTEIIVTNPSPIRWGGDEDKTDTQLQFQAKALNQLGSRLQGHGLTLAYHNHDAELRQGGREFHHMLTATDPKSVKLCLDAHWIYRGCGNSEIAVFDALAHYHERVVELHLRQSHDGIWTEAFSMKGDIDYPRLFDFLKQRNIEPHYVLEQAVEEKSPREMTVTEAHGQSRAHLAKAL